MFRRVASGATNAHRAAASVHSLPALCNAFSTTAAISARATTLSLDTETSEEPQLPRWMRRQHLQKEKDKGSTVAKKPETSKFRSKHLDARAAKPKEHIEEGLKLLEPHVLSKRLKKLCDRGKLDDAVALVKSSPLDAQNAPVWNTVIWEAMKAKRYKLAYSLYVDMKRRGHSPTTRTYMTMLNGLARIEDFSRHTQQLKNAHSLYEAYHRHIKSLKRFDPTDPELSVDPLAPYIKILGDAQRFNEIFDVFYSLDEDGPLAPNARVFTAMFQALAHHFGSQTQPSSSQPSVIKPSDARLLWTQVLKTAKRNQKSFVLDAHLATAAISALSRGQTTEHDLAFQIARDYFGLHLPGTPRVSSETTSTSAGTGTGSTTIPLSPYSISAIFRLCNTSHNPDLCIDFFNQIKRRPEHTGGVSLLDRLHMEEVLRAHQLLGTPGSAYQSLQVLEWMLRQEVTGPNGGRIRPLRSTFSTVLMTSWRSADWNAATRTFELMTGYHAHDFMDGSVAGIPRLDKRAKGRNLEIDTEGVSALVRTAYATRNRANIRQCLRIVDHLGLERLLARSASVYEVDGEGDEGREVDSQEVPTRKTMKNRGFYVGKLAEGIVQSVAFVLEGGSEPRYADQIGRWRAMQDRAKMELKVEGEEALVSTIEKTVASPLLENSRTPWSARGRKEREESAMAL